MLQVEERLHNRHIWVFGKYVTDKKTLVKALSTTGYAYPQVLGGLVALVQK